ncbi:hypothetical protein B1NLA3E_07095 [Bacillus sp. 1NLA3E]|nr:hypothetical protein B1NLA3E_07095 [Bacillus sp. 1NLA3E]
MLGHLELVFIKDIRENIIIMGIIPENEKGEINAKKHRNIEYEHLGKPFFYVDGATCSCNLTLYRFLEYIYLYKE